MSILEENTRLSFVAMDSGSLEHDSIIRENEAIIDFTNGELTRFLIELSAHVDQTSERVIGSYFHVINDLERIGDHALNLLGVAKEIDDNDKEIMKLIKGRKSIILFNKSDLDVKVDRSDIDITENTPVISISAKHQLGLEEFENVVKELFFNGEIKFNDEVYITNARQKNDIRQAFDSMNLVKKSIEEQMPEDFFTIDLMNAYELLGRVVGESVEDDLADKIFSEFCMGK